MGEVLASIVTDTFDNLSSKSTLRGVEKVLDVLAAGMRYTCAFEPLLNFLENNPQVGLKLLASADSAVHTAMTNSHMTDPEVLEARYPVRVCEFSIRRGSGGAGEHRGGDGVVRRIEFLAPMRAAIRAIGFGSRK